MDTRKTINGLRHYKCPGVPDYLPSVTSILSSTQSAKTQQKLAHWNIMNPGVADAAAARGTWIHEATENHIRGLKVVPPEAYAPFWKGVPERMDEILEGGRVLWSERPYNQPSWSKYVGDDGVGRIFYYDENTKHGYAGCCDLIYMDNNAEIVLADFKTSAGPYSARFPNKKSNVDEKTKKALISGVFKVKKTRLQLAAYKLAAEACLGIKISKTQIIVSTPMDEYQTQVFTFGESEVEKDELAWLALVDKFFNEVRPKAGQS
jgi:hypothetical protein